MIIDILENFWAFIFFANIGDFILEKIIVDFSKSLEIIFCAASIFW
jgi:hypothetical protein